MNKRWAEAILLIGVFTVVGACNTVPTPEPDEPDPSYTISDFVWFDLHYNGLQDPDETGIAGVVVNLYSVDEDDSENFSRSTETDALGFYEFTDLPAGNYVLEFIPPEDYLLTFKDRGDSDEKDSDADPQSGRTDLFPLNETEEKWDAGMVLEESAIVVPTATQTLVPTSTPITPTPLATSEITATPTPADETFVHLDDETEDAQDCTTEEPVEDGEVDLTRMLIQRQDGHLYVTVWMRVPLLNDYSFAVVIYLISADQVVAFVWEIHEGQLRIGMIDPQTGELILSVEEGGMEIQHDREMGTIAFNIHADLVPSPLDQFFVSSFHMPEEGNPRNCDNAGVYEIPEDLR